MGVAAIALRVVGIALWVAAVATPPSRAAAQAGAGCAGDCDADGRVAVQELIRGVNIALSRSDVSSCEAMDRNGDGQVGIGELIGAVGNALDGCACPFDLLDERAGGLEACVFAGSWSDGCSDSDLPATFSVQPAILGVAVVTGPDSPLLNFFAQPSDGRAATLVGYTYGDDVVQVGGEIRLSSDGRRLTIVPAVAIEVVIDGCPFAGYDGSFSRVVSTVVPSRP
jgi:hypothetical protein